MLYDAAPDDAVQETLMDVADCAVAVRPVGVAGLASAESGLLEYQVPVILPLLVPVGMNHHSVVRLRSTVWTEPLLKMMLDDVEAGMLKTYHPLPSKVAAAPGQVLEAGDPLEPQ